MSWEWKIKFLSSLAAPSLSILQYISYRTTFPNSWYESKHNVGRLCSTSNKASHPNHWTLHAAGIDSLAVTGKHNKLFSRPHKETRRDLRTGHIWWIKCMAAFGLN